MDLVGHRRRCELLWGRTRALGECILSPIVDGGKRFLPGARSQLVITHSVQLRPLGDCAANCAAGPGSNTTFLVRSPLVSGSASQDMGKEGYCKYFAGLILIRVCGQP